MSGTSPIIRGKSVDRIPVKTDPYGITDIFFSGYYGDMRGLVADYRTVAEGLNGGHIAVRVADYLPREIDEDDLECGGLTDPAERRIWRRSQEGGGWFHSLLKFNAYSWLKTQCDDEPIFEHRMLGRRADLASEAAKIVVECGNSSPGWMLESLLYEWRWAILPFVKLLPADRTQWGHQILLFDRGPSFGDWYEGVLQERTEGLRAAARALDWEDDAPLPTEGADR